MKIDRYRAQRETNRRLNEAEAARLFPGFVGWRRHVLRQAGLLIVLALLSASCASLHGPRHVATVSIVSVHAVLSAVQDGERLLVCDAVTAPAPPACVPPDVHRRIAGELVTAFDLDGQVARLVRAVRPGGVTSADVPALLGRIAAIIDRIFALMPASPQKAALAQKVGGV